MEWLQANASNLLQILFGLVGVFAVIATMTKNESDNKVADVLLKTINVLGGNFGNAKNATDKEIAALKEQK